VDKVSNKDEVRDVLTTRGASVMPDQVGLSPFVGKRCVPGLHREEVALLAGVSPDYDVRLGSGSPSGMPGSERTLCDGC
jgi:hypothetical protein